MKNLVVIAFLFTFSSIQAQVNVEYQTSDKLKDTKFTRLQSSAVTHDGERVMVVKSLGKLIGKDKQRLQMFDENMNVVADRTIEDVKIISIIGMKNNSYFLYYNDDGALFMRHIDEATMKGTEKPIKILQMDQIKTALGFKAKGFNRPKVLVSQDSTKVAFILEYDVKGKEIQEYAAAVYDQKIAKIWGKRFDVGLKSKDYQLTDTQVGNDGAIYLSGQILSDKKLLSKEFNEVLIQRISKDSQKKYNVNLDEDKKFVGEVSLVNSNSDAGIDLLAFMYSKVGLSDVLVAKLDENLEVVGKRINPVSFKDFIEDDNDTKKDKAKKGKKGAASEQRLLEIRHLSKLEGDKRLVIAEQYQLIEHQHYNSNTGSTSTTYSYFYGDVVVLLFNKEGNLLWAKKIPKSQRSANPTPLGISIFQGNDNAYILFNDHEKNENPDRERIKRYGKQFKNGIFKVVKINLEDGTTEEKLLFNLKEEGMYVEPTSYFQMHDNSLINMGFRGKDRSIIKMEFLDE